MEHRTRLTRAILLVVLAAAVLSAPIFLFAEDFDRAHVVQVGLSNGVCALFCGWLLYRLGQGHVDSTARLLVFGLLGIVGALASTNGEDVHVNVVNFLLVTVLASVLLGRRALTWVAGISAVLMTIIAYRQAVPIEGEELIEQQLESIAQFLPTYLVIVTILWLREAPRASAE